MFGKMDNMSCPDPGIVFFTNWVLARCFRSMSPTSGAPDMKGIAMLALSGLFYKKQFHKNLKGESQIMKDVGVAVVGEGGETFDVGSCSIICIRFMFKISKHNLILEQRVIPFNTSVEWQSTQGKQIRVFSRPILHRNGQRVRQPASLCPAIGLLPRKAKEPIAFSQKKFHMGTSKYP